MVGQHVDRSVRLTGEEQMALRLHHHWAANLFFVYISHWLFENFVLCILMLFAPSQSSQIHASLRYHTLSQKVMETSFLLTTTHSKVKNASQHSNAP